MTPSADALGPPGPPGTAGGGDPGGSPATPGGSEFPDHSTRLAPLAGQPAGPPQLAPSPVNEPMILHWVEAMGDHNPVYRSDEAARAAGLDRPIAPPAMLQAWTMRGLRATLETGSAAAGPHEVMMALLDDEGMTSVVATNCDQEYRRQLVPGDRLVASSVIESISPPKKTALGTGRFVTTRTDFVAVPDQSVGDDPDVVALAASGEPVATMRFRILKFRPEVPVSAIRSSPRTGEPPGEPRADPEPRPAGEVRRVRRPRPAITDDIAFWFDGARRHRLLIQRCRGCGELRHPPLPSCPRCRSFEWDTVEASGSGTLFSFVVVHYPEVPGFDYPLPIGLIELEEGTRLVAGLDGIEPSAWEIGMAVVAGFVDYDDELTLPVFRPATTARAARGG